MSATSAPVGRGRDRPAHDSPGIPGRPWDRGDATTESPSHTEP